MGAIAIYSSGMVTGVGLNAPASCAAIRTGITGFAETRFMFDGEWLQGCAVPLEEAWRGVERLCHMVVPSIRECLADADPAWVKTIPLLVCVAESDRPGRFVDLERLLLAGIAEGLGCALHPDSRVFANGRIGGVKALEAARGLIEGGCPACVVAGVDTYLATPTLAAYDSCRRLLTEANSNGFIPGEAGAAALVGPIRRLEDPQLMCLGLGYGSEPAPMDSGEPLRANGLAAAISSAFADSRSSYQDVDFRITDNNGESFGFKDAALAMARTMRDRKEEFDLWHPADCVGEVGAAIVPLILGVVQAAMRKGYAPGPGALCQISGDADERAAVILRYRTWSGD